VILPKTAFEVLAAGLHQLAHVTVPVRRAPKSTGYRKFCVAAAGWGSSATSRLQVSTLRQNGAQPSAGPHGKEGCPASPQKLAAVGENAAL